MGKLSRDMSESTKAKAGEGPQITVEKETRDALANNLGMKPQDVQDNLLKPKLEDATANLTRILEAELNPELKDTELIPQLTPLLTIVRTQTGVAADQASKTLGAVRELIRKTKNVKITPAWKKQVKVFVSLVKKQQAEPENKEVAERARMRGATVTENHSLYLELQKTDIPKERIDAFMDKRAETAARVMDEGIAAGLPMDQIEKNQKDARKNDAKEFLIQAREERYEVPQEVVEKFEIFIDIADKRSELYDANAYLEASKAESYADYAGVLGNAGLGFAISPPSLQNLEAEAGEESGAEEAAAQAQMMLDIENLAKEDQEHAEAARAMIEELMEQAEEAGEETTVGDLKDEELKERLEEMGVEQDKTIKQAIEFTNKTLETVAIQQGRVAELKQNAVEGLEPSFHTNPDEALEMNGVMKDGKLTEFGQDVLPDIMRVSGGSFNNALDQIMDAIPIEEREEFMERVDGARLTINEYLADPGNAEKQEAATEILINPEFVAVRAAFQEALADNAAEVIGKRNA
ncbi:MAG: hypothetical protein GY852_06710 [bacterium]|nr:hypothetical protein [bacterium]